MLTWLQGFATYSIGDHHCDEPLLGQGHAAVAPLENSHTSARQGSQKLEANVAPMRQEVGIQASADFGHGSREVGPNVRKKIAQVQANQQSL